MQKLLIMSAIALTTLILSQNLKAATEPMKGDTGKEVAVEVDEFDTMSKEEVENQMEKDIKKLENDLKDVAKEIEALEKKETSPAKEGTSPRPAPSSAPK